MNRQDIVLGRRISVRGVTGSGKSTLARALGEALGLKVIELDAINWQRPGWDQLSTEEFRAQVTEAIASAPDGWVIEGNYSAVADIYLAQIDTMVWLHLPWRTSFSRMVRRTLQRARKKELLWGAQHESLKTQLFSRKNSLWWWGIHHHNTSVRNTRRLFESMQHIRTYELRSTSDVRELVEAAKRPTASA
ncbi:MAG: shikimate kinase [Dehalococcoidia bacterium]